MTQHPEDNLGHLGSSGIALRCPACRMNGVFHGYANVADLSWTATDRGVAWPWRAGLRACPNRECRALIFYAMRRDQVFATYPPEALDFDSTDLPGPIAASMDEAAKCFSAGAFRASALMVRRVLEELCEDKGAAGANLKLRLEALGQATLVPAELLEAADELRILGNDAAHIEAKAYDQIGKEECEAALMLAKELLKAVYQYQSLVAQLRALKRAAES